jgi:hypothetical protein
MILVYLQAITAAGTRLNESIFGELQTQLKTKNLTVDIKTNSESDVSRLCYTFFFLSLMRTLCANFIAVFA